MIINKAKFITLASMFTTPLAIAAPTSPSVTNTAPASQETGGNQSESTPEAEWCRKACFALCARAATRCRTTGKSSDFDIKERTELCEESCVPLCATWE